MSVSRSSTLNRSFNDRIEVMGNEPTNAKTFHLEVDLEAVAGDPADELARVLRYWAGNLKHYSFEQPHREAVMDSEYREVGHWSLS